MEERFRLFVVSLDSAELPRLLKKMNVEECPPEHREVFVFWKSLSGHSRNLMLDNALGRRLRKKY